MKLKFYHTLGCQERAWVQVSVIFAEVERHEEKEALEGGWLLEDKVWYQTRSTRLRCSEFKSKKKWPDGYSFEIGDHADFNAEEMNAVYQAYIAHCGFSNYANHLSYDMDRSKFGVVKKDGRIVAFTKFCIYNGGIGSDIFCWDYSDPKVSLGIAIQAKEVEYAMSLGNEFIYLGPGYERGCQYKARFPGFEWWSGTEWSSDVEEYKRLCERDSAVLTDDVVDKFKVLIDEEVRTCKGKS